jgi:hypothetical protein
MVRAAKPEWLDTEPDLATRVIAESEKGAFDATQFLSTREMDELEGRAPSVEEKAALALLVFLLVFIVTMIIRIWIGES